MNRPIPIHFGPTDRPLFGLIDRPVEGAARSAVVLCPPLGFEGSFSSITFHDLSIRLVEQAGAAVLRFDYDGTGDSAGGDEDPERVARWRDSVGHAIDELRRRVGPDLPLLVLGLRAGALLAATVAATRGDVQGLVLWAPCPTGKAFLREQKALSTMTLANAADPQGAAPDWGERGFESNGYVFPDRVVRDLEQLRLDSLGSVPSPSVLVLNRRGLPGGFTPPAGWSASGAGVVVEEVDGYGEMMEPPWLWRAPLSAFDRICRFVREAGVAHPVALPADVPAAAPAQVERGVIEEPLWLGPGRGSFAIVTRPADGSRGPAVVHVTSTFGYRIGPNRLNVLMARLLARRGMASIRLDIRGTGESRDSSATPLNPYDIAPVAEVRQAIERLRAAGHSRVALTGICAGAFLAWQAAIAERQPVDLLLVNPEAYHPMTYTPRDHVDMIAGPASPGGQGSRWRAALRVDHAMRTARAWVGLGVRVVSSAMPSALLPRRVPARFIQLTDRGGRAAAIFSNGDHGLLVLRQLLYFKRRGLEERGLFELSVIDGPDHNFTPRWAARRLMETADRILHRWYPAAAGPAGADGGTAVVTGRR